MAEKNIINILGEQIPIRFNMAVEIAYEEIIDAPFDFNALSRQLNSLALGMAAILVAKPDTAITIDRLMNEASGKEISELNAAVVSSMSDWFAIPAVVKDDEKEEPEEEAKGKN